MIIQFEKSAKQIKSTVRSLRDVRALRGLAHPAPTNVLGAQDHVEQHERLVSAVHAAAAPNRGEERARGGEGDVRVGGGRAQLRSRSKLGLASASAPLLGPLNFYDPNPIVPRSSCSPSAMLAIAVDRRCKGAQAEHHRRWIDESRESITYRFVVVYTSAPSRRSAHEMVPRE